MDTDMDNQRTKAVFTQQEKVFGFIREHHMLEPGDRVVIGVSGGADSLCLLFVLWEWARQMPLSLAVAHVNHGIRREASQDARFVEEICRQRQIPFYLTRADVRARAAREGCSEEEAGRNVRYEAFFQTAEQFGANKIAVAHNANDCSETMLFHLLRGTGLKGLCGIPPVRGKIIRPLLCLERREIEEYLKKRGECWCLDATNDGDEYTRNRIRHHILPYAEREIAPGCVSRMAGTAALLSETEDYLELQTREALAGCLLPQAEEGCVEIEIAALMKEHIAIRRRVLFAALKKAACCEKDISQIHVEGLLSLCEREGNRSLDMPYGVHVMREYGRLRLIKKTQPGSSLSNSQEQSKSAEALTGGQPLEQSQVELFQLQSSPRTVSLGKAGSLIFSLLSPEQCRALQGEALQNPEKEVQVPQNECTKWFDYDKINKSLAVRTRQTGDYLTVSDGRGGQLHKSLKNHMIAVKIPARQRDALPVIAEGHHILWLVGGRISEFYKISRNTKHILQVQLKRDCAGSKTEENYVREY